MKNMILKGALVAATSVVLTAGAANAALVSEWGVVNPGDMSADFDTMISAIQGYNDYGYFIWTDTSARQNFHIAWTADPQTSVGGNLFTGEIAFQGTGYTDLNTIRWESPFKPPVGDFVWGGEDINFSSFNVGGVDGISFSLTDWEMPSYVGFDLSINTTEVDANSGDVIFLGASMVDVTSLGQDGDFAVAAPVPEPATMVLFGVGLVGLAGVARRRNLKQ